MATALDTVPGRTVDRNGVKLIAGNDLLAPWPTTPAPCTPATSLALISSTLADGVLTLDTEDELIAGCLVAQDGGIRRGDVLTPGAMMDPTFVEFLWVLLLGSLLALSSSARCPPPCIHR